MKHYITIALCTFLSQMCTAQVMMLFSQDSLTGIVSPLDVDSLFYWFAADVGVTDSLGGAIATDEGVGTWNDLSGNGYHVTQSTNGARPVWKATGGPGSKPCIQFDGTNDFLASAAHFWGSDDLTVFVVMKFGNATRDAIEAVASKLENATDKRQWNVFARNASASYFFDCFLYKSGTNTPYKQNRAAQVKHSDWKVHAITNNGTSAVAWYVDAVSSTVTTTDFGGADFSIYDTNAKLWIGSQETALYLQGSISEIIIFSRALTATERTAIELYLNRKYDLYYLIILGFPLASARRRKLIPNEKKNAA